MSARRQLLLWRHAKSSWDDPSLEDFDRPLNDRGRKAARRMAKHMLTLGLMPDVVLCSPARRTRSTLDRLLALVGDVPVRYDENIYEAHPDDVLGAIRATDKGINRLLIVGHNPGLELLARRIAGKGSDQAALDTMRKKFPTGALAVFDVYAKDWGKLVGGEADLVRFDRPRFL